MPRPKPFLQGPQNLCSAAYSPPAHALANDLGAPRPDRFAEFAVASDHNGGEGFSERDISRVVRGQVVAQPSYGPQGTEYADGA